MDVNMLRTILLVLCLAAFLGIVWWAYSKKNTDRHTAAANLPFDDDPIHEATISAQTDKTRGDQ